MLSISYMTKAEKTRQFIIEKTAPVFNVKGYAGTSLADMTDATGLTKGSIYGNFNGKDEVALAVFDYNVQKLNDFIQREIDKCVTYTDKLMVYGSVYDKILQNPHTAGGCPILNTATEADDTHPQLRKKALAAIMSWKNKIVSLINGGKENREFRADVQAEEIAVSIIAMIEGGIMITKLSGKLGYLQTAMQSVKKIISDLK